ncbi:MAG: lysophospholipid acyltransferase family protein [Deltaproteobacteria bacterium]|nr:lysophospholipid acyltransferase family protein [Deltaproteobacteria bacterium]
MIRKLWDRILFNLIPYLAKGIVLLILKTMRTEMLGEEHPREFWVQGKGIVFSIWHEQLLLLPAVYHGPGLTALTSLSRDGELVSSFLKVFRIGAVRGSSSRHGMAALKEMVRLSRSGADLVITPDGPRGPRQQLKAGLVQLAKLADAPIIVMSFACSRGYRFRSWDRFLLPCPFSRGIFCYSAPIYPDKEEDIETFRLRMQEKMAENQQRAARRLEEFGVSAV